MSDITDVGEIGEVRIITDLKLCLIVLDNTVESTDHLSVARTKDPSGSDCACEQGSLSVGLEDHRFRGDFCLVISVQRLFRVWQTFVGCDNVAFAVVDDAARRRVDEFTDVVGETLRDNILGTENIDEVVDLFTEIVCGGSSVDDGCSARLGLAVCFHRLSRREPLLRHAV